MTREEMERWHRKHPYGARDARYVDAVLAAIKQRWLRNPTQRLGQLLINAAGDGLWHVGDELWLDAEESRDGADEPG